MTSAPEMSPELAHEMAEKPLVVQIPASSIVNDESKCDEHVFANPYGPHRSLYQPVKAELRPDGNYYVTQHFCRYRVWEALDPGRVPVILKGTPLDDPKYDVEDEETMHIFTEAHVILLLREREYRDADIGEELGRSNEQVRAIALLAALPNWVQTRLLRTLSSAQIERLVFMPLAANLEQLIQLYSPDPNREHERISCFACY